MNNDNSRSTIQIRELNDAFRRTFVGGAALITATVAAMPAEQRRSLLRKVREFDVSDEDNDPHVEHDLGVVEVAAVRYFWKIDYYDRETETLSPDPADPSVTTRVLTVMRADEYWLTAPLPQRVVIAVADSPSHSASPLSRSSALRRSGRSGPLPCRSVSRPTDPVRRSHAARAPVGCCPIPT